jgi:hypothetical protein
MKEKETRRGEKPEGRKKRRKFKIKETKNDGHTNKGKKERNEGKTKGP